MTQFKDKIRWPALSFYFLVVSCMPLIGPYSPTAYQNATSLKAETLVLMDKAANPYDSQKEKVDALVVELHKAHEYVKGVPSNSISAQMWDILIREDGDLLGKFFTRWKQRGKLNKAVIVEYKKLVSAAFDEIICLEANKKEPTECK